MEGYVKIDSNGLYDLCTEAMEGIRRTRKRDREKEIQKIKNRCKEPSGFWIFKREGREMSDQEAEEMLLIQNPIFERLCEYKFVELENFCIRFLNTISYVNSNTVFISVETLSSLHNLRRKNRK